jgi:hypothetical protein
MLVDGQRSEGLELDATAAHLPGWRIAGGYASQRAVLTATQSAAELRRGHGGECPGTACPCGIADDFSAAARRWRTASRSAVYASVSNTVALPGFARVDGAVLFQAAAAFPAAAERGKLIQQEILRFRPQQRQHRARFAPGAAHDGAVAVLVLQSSSL